MFSYFPQSTDLEPAYICVSDGNARNEAHPFYTINLSCGGAFYIGVDAQGLDGIRKLANAANSVVARIEADLKAKVEAATLVVSSMVATSEAQ